VVADLSVLGWKISRASVDSGCTLLKEVLEELWEGDTVVIYQMVDNTTYYAVMEDGTAMVY
jgi:hypothetical protein